MANGAAQRIASRTETAEEKKGKRQTSLSLPQSLASLRPAAPPAHHTPFRPSVRTHPAMAGPVHEYATAGRHPVMEAGYRVRFCVSLFLFFWGGTLNRTPPSRRPLSCSRERGLCSHGHAMRTLQEGGRVLVRALHGDEQRPREPPPPARPGAPSLVCSGAPAAGAPPSLLHPAHARPLSLSSLSHPHSSSCAGTRSTSPLSWAAPWSASG